MNQTPFEREFDFFDDLIQRPINRLIQTAVSESKVPVGYTCSYIPHVLLSVGDLFPIRMRAPGIEGTENADQYLPHTICSYCKSLLEYAMTDQYEDIRGWVFASSCQHMSRFYDNLKYVGKSPYTHMLDVPRLTDEDAINWYTGELRELVQSLSKEFHVDFSKEKIEDAIHRYNAFNEALTALNNLRKEASPVICGKEFYRIMIAALSALEEENYRILFWNTVFVHFIDCFAWAEQKYGAALIIEFLSFNRLDYIDTSSNESVLSGLSDVIMNGPMARHVRGEAANNFDDIFHICKKWDIDMIWAGDHIGCKAAAGFNGMLREMCREKEIPLLLIPYDAYDTRLASSEDIKKDIDDFMETVMMAKPRKKDAVVKNENRLKNRILNTVSLSFTHIKVQLKQLKKMVQGL